MWQPVGDKSSLTERIVEQVETLIQDESLRPGDRLPAEREMAQLLRVSRPSLREAIRILEARGQLSVRHGRGVFVLAPTSEQELRSALAAADTDMTLDELFAMREVLEVPATGWAAERISPAQLTELGVLLDRMAGIVEAPSERDYVALRDLDVQFHMRIAMAAGNRFLRQTANVLHDLLRSGMETTLTIPGRAELSRRDHERIYEALRNADPATARRAARAHIRAAHAAAQRRGATTARPTDDPPERTRRTRP